MGFLGPYSQTISSSYKVRPPTRERSSKSLSCPKVHLGNKRIILARVDARVFIRADMHALLRHSRIRDHVEQDKSDSDASEMLLQEV